MAAEIDAIEIKITESTSGAEKRINDLIGSLNNLKQALNGISGRGLKSFVGQFHELNSAVGDTSETTNNISRLATAFRGLEGLSNVKINKNLSVQIRDLAISCMAFTDDVIDRTFQMSAALQNLSGLDLSGLRVPNQNAAGGVAGADASGSAAAASAKQEQVAQSAKRVGDASEEAEEKVSRLSRAFGRLKGSIATKQLRDCGKAADEAEGKLSKLAMAFKRIMLYRALRSLIREITQAFSEGLQQAYRFSQGITTEGHRFSVAMDSMKTSVTQMKGQLGSAFIGLLTALQPVIEKLVELVTKLADIISQFFAAFTGGTYLKAIRTQVSFADATAKGAKAAKEWKNQLLGFDEINKLNAPSDTSRSGLDLADGYDFEDTAISERIKNFVDKIKEKFRQFTDGIDFSRLKESLGNLGESFSKLWERIKKNFVRIWNEVLSPLAKWTIEKVAPLLIDALAEAFDLLSAVCDALAPILEPLWENVLKPLFGAVGVVIVTGLEELVELLHDLTALIRGDIGWDEFLGNLDAFKVALLALGGVAVLKGIASLTSHIGSFIAAVTGKLVASPGLMIAAIGAVSAIAISKTKELIGVLAELHHQRELEAQANERQLSEAQDNYSHLLEKCGKATADQYAMMVHSIDTTNMTLAEAQDAISRKVKDIQNGIIKDGAEYSKKYENVGEQSMKGLEQGFLDGLAKLTHSSIFTKLAEFNRKVQQSVGSNSITFSASVRASGKPARAYATGGMPRTGEMFIARERGPELVGTIGNNTAVANNEQIESGIEEAAYRGFIRAIAATGSNQKSGGDFVLNINGREFARATYNDYKAAARENGGSLIKNFA